MSLVGDRLEPVEFHVTEEVLRGYREATGATALEADGAEGDVSGDVPPTLASVYTYGVIAQLPIRRGAILAGQRFRFRRRVRVADRLITEAHVAERYEKRGRQYMVLGTQTHNQDGALVCEGRLTRILPGPPSGDRA